MLAPGGEAENIGLRLEQPSNQIVLPVVDAVE
jgi:hypothetical protein